jgi:hypothetical protein
MKRDMDLIRTILQRIESDQDLTIEGHGSREISYHVALLKDAGFLDAYLLTDGFGRIDRAVVKRLTWDGHEFLDATRDDTLWRKARKHVLKPAASWTFGLLLEWLKREAHRRVFGGPPDGSGTP